MAVKLANNAVSRLAGNISNSATTINLVPGEGARFPTLAAGDWFPLTLVKTNGDLEIVRATARSSDTITIVRAQENTTAQAFSAGDRVEIRLTSGTLEGEITRIEGLANTAQDTADTKAPLTRSIATSTGLLGGGNLTADRTLSIDIATQAEAEAGTSNTKVMTPLRTRQAIAAQVPPGTVIYVAMNTAPTGYLKCNGAAVSRTTYAALFAVIGTTFGAGNGSTTFNLPDLRGEFIRGWDDGRGVDSGRAFGSAQAQAIQSHTHQQSHTGTGNAGQIQSGGGSVGTTPASVVTQPTGGPETRPRNVALLACIKT
jgi:microcystin-dependent protein